MSWGTPGNAQSPGSAGCTLGPGGGTAEALLCCLSMTLGPPNIAETAGLYQAALGIGATPGSTGGEKGMHLQGLNKDAEYVPLCALQSFK